MMRALLLLAVFLVFVSLVCGCTTSHTYVSTGEGSKAGPHTDTEASSRIGIGRNVLQEDIE